MTFAATRHVSWAPNTLKNVVHAFLMYLEPRQRVWWLQMSFFLTDGS